MSGILVTGAAGFIGSQLVDHLLESGHDVIGIDNFVRGTKENIATATKNSSFALVDQDLADYDATLKEIDKLVDKGTVDMVWHMAANSDISAGINDPKIDLRDTFLTTFNTLELCRKYEIKKLAFASTSAVYGDLPKVLTEDIGPLFPISNYGAMKLASEASISAAVESFLDKSWIFRFPNVVGPRSTHGAIYDFINKLKNNKEYLEVLGDGNQQKSYLHVSELLEAMFFIVENANDRLNFFNIGPNDDGATVRFIADTVIKENAPGAEKRFTGGQKGWVGDVPRFEYSIEKLEHLGWHPKLKSEQAIARAVAELSQV